MSVQGLVGNLQLDLLREAPLKNEEIVALVSLISQAETVDGFKEHLKVLTDKYDMTLEMRSLPLEVLSLREEFNIRTLRNFYSGIESEGYNSLIIPFITAYQNDKSAAVYLEQMYEVFQPKLTSEFIRFILGFIQESAIGDEDNIGVGTDAMIKYFQNVLYQVTEYAPVPDYVHAYPIEIKDLPRLTKHPVDPSLPNEYIAEYLLGQLNNYLVADGLGNLGDDPEIIKATLIQRLEAMGQPKREEFIRLFEVDSEDIVDIQKNKDVFRVYGPVNPFPDTDYSILTTDDDQPDVNVIFGGARMFTDMALEYDYENDLPVDDWFTGHCEQCGDRIKAYFHAIREPNVDGGWIGCFCAKDNGHCLIENIVDRWGDNPDLKQLLEVKISLIKIIMEDLANIGIADRDYQLGAPNNLNFTLRSTEEQLEAEAMVGNLSTLPKL